MQDESEDIMAGSAPEGPWNVVANLEEEKEIQQKELTQVCQGILGVY